MITEHTCVRAAESLVSSYLKEDLILLDLHSGTYYGLNRVGARIWNLIQQPIEVAEIRRVLLQEYAVQPEALERDLLALLEKMESQKLIYIEHEAATAISPALLDREEHVA